jgi:hypothetical protein
MTYNKYCEAYQLDVKKEPCEVQCQLCYKFEIRPKNLNEIIKPFDGVPNSKDLFIEFTKTGDGTFTWNNLKIK